MLHAHTKFACREFYTCFKNRDDPEKCKFFKWADELPTVPPPTIDPAMTPPGSPSKRSRRVERTPPTPNVSPSKTSPRSAFACSQSNHTVTSDDDIIGSDEEIAQFLKGTSNTDRPSKKFKFSHDRTEDTPSADPSSLGTKLLGESRGTSPSKPLMQATSQQWPVIRDDPVRDTAP